MKKNNIISIAVFLVLLTGHFFTSSIQAMQRNPSDIFSPSLGIPVPVNILPIPRDPRDIQQLTTEALQEAQERDRVAIIAVDIKIELLELLRQELAECASAGINVDNIIAIQMRYNTLFLRLVPNYIQLPERLRIPLIDQLLRNRDQNIERFLASVNPQTLNNAHPAFNLILQLALQGSSLVYNYFGFTNPALFDALCMHSSPADEAKLDEWYDAYFPAPPQDNVVAAPEVS